MPSILKDKTYGFAIRIVKLHQFLQNERREFSLSKQILRSGTSIGALVAEAAYAQSKKDFVSKLSIAIKDSHETEYWLNLLKDTKFIDANMFQSLIDDLVEILKILTSSIKTAKASLAEK